jgi:hypothetical protein
MGRRGTDPRPSVETNGIAIRRAGPADAPAIAEIWLRSFGATYDFPPAHPDDDVRRWVRDELVPTTETWVAVGETSARIVGFMSLERTISPSSTWTRAGSGAVSAAAW